MDPAEAFEASILSQQQPMLAAMGRGQSEVQRFYNNCAVLLTGGSGFLGKQLAHKLLSLPKKGKGVQERLKEVLNDPVFEILHQKQPKFINKIITIEGDVAEIRLGIKDEDWETLTKEVNVIFHVAATTRFDESLQRATFINVRGTREALLLGKACKKLRSFVHVSTAYSHATPSLLGAEVKEEFYESPLPPNTLISMAENISNDRLNAITKNLIKEWPNTYTFTKAVAEEQVRSLSDGLPVCVVRPSIVLNSYREPSPGWLDKSCIYGITGLVLAGCLGIMHTVLAKGDVTIGLIPCDYVNNAIIAAARETASRGGDHTKIYTVCSTNRNPVQFKTVYESIKVSLDLASPKILYYGFTISTTNKFLYKILSIFFHVIPAYFTDLIFLALGKERRYVKLINKLDSMFDVVQFLATNEWCFLDSNTERLYNRLSEEDQAIFNFDVNDIKWTEFVRTLLIGLRRYILKDGLRNSEYALKKLKFLRVLHYFVMAAYLFCIWKFINLVYFFLRILFSYLY